MRARPGNSSHTACFQRGALWCQSAQIMPTGRSSSCTGTASFEAVPACISVARNSCVKLRSCDTSMMGAMPLPLQTARMPGLAALKRRPITAGSGCDGRCTSAATT
ncbi:hypothetical protein D9M68_804200 [compost metagenome]